MLVLAHQEPAAPSPPTRSRPSRGRSTWVPTGSSSTIRRTLDGALALSHDAVLADGRVPPRDRRGRPPCPTSTCSPRRCRSSSPPAWSTWRSRTGPTTPRLRPVDGPRRRRGRRPAPAAQLLWTAASSCRAASTSTPWTGSTLPRARHGLAGLRRQRRRPCWSSSTVEHGHVAIHPNERFVTQELVERLHAAGPTVNTWTCDEPRPDPVVPRHRRRRAWSPTTRPSRWPRSRRAGALRTSGTGITRSRISGSWRISSALGVAEVVAVDLEGERPVALHHDLPPRRPGGRSTADVRRCFPPTRADPMIRIVLAEGRACGCVTTARPRSSVASGARSSGMLPEVGVRVRVEADRQVAVVDHGAVGVVDGEPGPAAVVVPEPRREPRVHEQRVPGVALEAGAASPPAPPPAASNPIPTWKRK